MYKSMRAHPSQETRLTPVCRSIEELLMKFTYGYQPSAEQLQLAKKAMGETGAALQPGKWRVDSMPACKTLQPTSTIY